MKSKKELEVFLSKLEQVTSPKINLEQYATPADVAAEILWYALMQNDIENKIVADLGCGNGILGIGASLLGAKKVIFLDSDNSSLFVAKRNFETLKLRNAVYLNKNVNEFKDKVDTIIENPPFGVQNKHADRAFLIKAMASSKTIYSFHKIETKEFVFALARDYGFKVENIFEFEFVLKKAHGFHKKGEYMVDVGCFLLRKL
ncbi:MAG: METTL5 family protein [Nanoarchaeota archaeon]